MTIAPFVLLPIICISFEYYVLNTGSQMEYFPPKLIKHNSFTYKAIPKPVFGEAKGHEHESHQYKKDIMIYDACQPNMFFQTTFCYAVPFSLNTSENAPVINLGNTLLDTSTYTVSHGIQEQTSFATSVSGNNFPDIVTNGTNEDTAQTPVTNSSQLNSSRHLPTNGIQEDTLQNVEPGNDQISTPTDSISDETQEAARTSASADTQLDPVSDTASYRSQEELDQTLAEQLRLGTLTGNIWSLCLYRVTEIERCDISSDKTSTEVAGNLFMSSFKSQHISEEIDVRTSIKRSKGLSNRVLNNVPGEREPLVSKNDDPEKQTDRKYKNNKKEDV